MSDTPMGLKLGQTVPDFDLTTFDPVRGDFGKFSLNPAAASGLIVHRAFDATVEHDRLEEFGIEIELDPQPLAGP